MATLKKPGKKDQALVYQSDTIRYEQAYSLNHFELLGTIELAKIVALVLDEILQRTNKLSSTFNSVFNSKYPNRISISTYLTKIIEEFKCSQECLILSMIYIDRLTKCEPRFIIQSKNVHRYESIIYISSNTLG